MSLVQKYSSRIQSTVLSIVVMAMSCLLHDGKAHAQNMTSYCRIPVFEVPFHPLGGQATFDMLGNPVILIDPTIMARLPFPHGQNFLRFLTAHECAHHLKGHVFNLAQAGAFGGYVLMQVSHSVEMDADCEAARMLSRRGDSSAIESAFWVFMNSNPFPTSTHPGGSVRAHNIRRCAG